MDTYEYSAHSFTALHYAVQGDSPSCVKVLATSGYTTHVASANDLSVTPLMMAAENGLHNCIEVILHDKEYYQHIQYF